MGIFGKIADLFRREEGPAVALEAGPAAVTFTRDNRPKRQPFVALVDFESVELRSMYCAGMQYAAREGDEALLRLLPKWREEGKVDY